MIVGTEGTYHNNCMIQINVPFVCDVTAAQAVLLLTTAI